MVKATSINLPFVRSVSFNWNAILGAIQILAIVTALFLFVLYLFQINYFASENYLVRDYQGRLDGLRGATKALEISSLQANSLDSVSSSLESLNLERVDKTHYIRVLDAKVVTK